MQCCTFFQGNQVYQNIYQYYPMNGICKKRYSDKRENHIQLGNRINIEPQEIDESEYYYPHIH